MSAGNDIVRRVLVIAGAFAAPIVLASAARQFVGSAPRRAAAVAVEGPSAEAQLASSDAVKLSAAQRAAWEWAANRVTAALSPMRILNKPVVPPPPPPPVAVAPEPQPDPEPAPPPPPPKKEPVPSFKLTSLMGSARGAIARINGNMVRLGEEAAEGWVFLRVERGNSAVTLRRESDGEEVTIALDE